MTHQSNHNTDHIKDQNTDHITALYREMRPLLLAQAGRTPAMAVQDYVKLLYQAEFGGGHLIDDPDRSLERLVTEARQIDEARPSAPDTNPTLYEPIGNGLARLHLQGLLRQADPVNSSADRQTAPAMAFHTDDHARQTPDREICLRTLNRLFVSTANTHHGSLDAFRDRLTVLQMASDDGLIPLNPVDVRRWLDDYAQRGWPMLSHSDHYRRMYQPAYRVIRYDQARFFDLYCQIERLLGQRERVIIAIDGSSGTGKSTLASQIASVHDGAIYHMDDYFLRPEQRTPQRFNEPGGNVDRERFHSEVLEGVLAGRPFTYRPFDCHTMTIGDPVTATPNRLTIIEGVYSLHPDLRETYDWKVCLRINREDQLKRILQRGGEHMLERFKKEWIPLEDHYLNSLHITDISDQVIDIVIE